MSARKKTFTRKTSGSFDRVAGVFDEALALPSAERLSFLRALREREPDLHDEVRSLLSAHDDAGNFLEESPGPQLVAAIEEKARKKPPAFAAGDVLGDFEILRPIGKGGFATVYLARQKSLGREVALKVSRNVGQEGRVMATLEHDHILKVYSEGTDTRRDLRFISMPYVPGTSLDKIIDELAKLPVAERRGASILDIVDRLVAEPTPFHPASMQFRQALARLDFVETGLWIGSRLAETLAYAHQRGVLHLDVKPGNILFNAYGRFLLSDFNVSFSPKAARTGSLTLGGTTGYMAPEQVRVFDDACPADAAARIDGRADVYSLGVLLKNFFALADVRRGTEPCWTATLERAVQPSPEKRFPDAASLARALHGCLDLYRVQRRLPAPGFIEHVGFRHPLSTLVLYGLVPQVGASVVNILYNQLQIVSRLSEEQQRFFVQLMWFYNPAIYGVCVGLWSWLLARLIRDLRAPTHDAAHESQSRGRLLRLTRWVSFITTLGWLPSSLLFPLCIHWGSSALTPATFGHFFVSFVFSWLVALAYSGLFIQFICVRVLYPRFWRFPESVRQTAHAELAHVSRWARIFHFLTSFVPLLGAMLLLMTARAPADPAEFHVLAGLASLLVAMGMAGSWLGTRESNQLLQTLVSFRGADRRR